MNVPPPLLNVIGCGALGRALVGQWVAKRAVRVGVVRTRSLETSVEAVSRLGVGTAVAPSEPLPSAALWLFGTTDDALGHAVAAVESSGAIRTGDLCFHCSGIYGSDKLVALAGRGAHIGSAHPFMTFPRNAASEALSLKDAVCGIEGDVVAMTTFRHLFGELLAMRCVELSPGCKPLYHLGAVLASNHLVTLIDAAQACLTKAGIPADLAIRMITTIGQATLLNVQAAGPLQALSGPLLRGDEATLQLHHEALAASLPALEPLYLELNSYLASVISRK